MSREPSKRLDDHQPEIFDDYGGPTIVCSERRRGCGASSYDWWDVHAALDAARAVPEPSGLREAAVAVCNLWFTENVPDGDQHLRKYMLDLRAALSPSTERSDEPS